MIMLAYVTPLGIAEYIGGSGLAGAPQYRLGGRILGHARRAGAGPAPQPTRPENAGERGVRWTMRRSRPRGSSAACCC